MSDIVDRLRDSSGGHINGAYDNEAADEIERLRKFIAALFDNWPDDLGIDGFDLQDLAEKYGLLIPHTVTVPCGETCSCAEYHGDMSEGVTCYRRVDWLAAIAKEKG